MGLDRRLDQLERRTRDRAARLAAVHRPRSCVDCGILVPPLEAPPAAYMLDIPRCDACELRHLGAVFAILEESGGGPSWAFDRYLEAHGVGRDEALERLRGLDLSDAPAGSEESLLAIAIAVADMGVDPTDGGRSSGSSKTSRDRLTRPLNESRPGHIEAR